MSAIPVADVSTDQISEIAEEISAIKPDISSGRNLGLIFGGFIVGAGLGAGLSFVLSRRILETKYNQIAEEEIATMREHYQNKIMAHENAAAKADLETIVLEQGYTEKTEPPMAVSPPTAVIEAAEEAQENEVTVVPKVESPSKPEEVVRNIFEETTPADNWDYHKELTKRSPVRPYVIHLDEREERSYDEITMTYYEADDVLCDERDEVIGELDRDRMVGEGNLERFGHGSNDASIVYIRNDKLEAQYEIIKSPNSYAHEVHGFEHADTRRYRRGRLTFDDE